jgi:L-asparaginase/Glu-tRNA(Gln) amidotransferase subunit D
VKRVRGKEYKYQNLDHSLMKRMKYSKKIIYKVVYITNLIYRLTVEKTRVQNRDEFESVTENHLTYIKECKIIISQNII